MYNPILKSEGRFLPSTDYLIVKRGKIHIWIERLNEIYSLYDNATLIASTKGRFLPLADYLTVSI
ncbi:MAG: hypothetical protein SNH27_16290 [Rikenellaceae bacterium]